MPTITEIEDKVRKRLKEVRVGEDITLSLVPDTVKPEDDWWYVQVVPSEEPAKTTDYYEALAEVETRLMEEDDLNILFVPIWPGKNGNN